MDRRRKDEAGAWASKPVLVLLAILALLLGAGLAAHTIRLTKDLAIIKSNLEALRPGPQQSRGAVHFIPPRNRDLVGQMLQQLGFQTGVELGVQRGHYAKAILDAWPKCQKYYLVDAWEHQKNYSDIANVAQEEHNAFLTEAKQVLSNYAEKTVFIRKFTKDAVQDVPNDVDFVYVDARHDYCGVEEDILLYWPKVRPGGVMAGHDYLTAPEVPPGQDWSLCMDGTKKIGAVKGAVDNFAMKNNLQVFVTYQDPPWSTWIILKPQ